MGTKNQQPAKRVSKNKKISIVTTAILGVGLFAITAYNMKSVLDGAEALNAVSSKLNFS